MLFQASISFTSRPIILFPVALSCCSPIVCHPHVYMDESVQEPEEGDGAGHDALLCGNRLLPLQPHIYMDESVQEPEEGDGAGHDALLCGHHLLPLHPHIYMDESVQEPEEGDGAGHDAFLCGNSLLPLQPPRPHCQHPRGQRPKFRQIRFWRIFSPTFNPFPFF
jgi:hypothetical protein